MISNLFKSLKHGMASSSSTTKQPAGLNKQGRARFAKDTVNNYIPHVLKSDDKARHGIKKTELMSYSASSVAPKLAAKQATGEASNLASKSFEPPVKDSAPPVAVGGAPTELPSFEDTADHAGSSKPTGEPAQPEQQPPTIRVIQSDTYDAVEAIIKSPGFRGRAAVLNMASALHPGGGFLNGAIAQEESLCLRSTLYAALDDSFYRLPEDAAIYSPDILVFRSADNQDMPKADWFYTDVISCAALKNPETMLENRKGTQKVVYEWQEDYEKMLMKVRLILQIAKEKRITHLVLGALGCGAYHNPTKEVAEIFRKVILGGRKRAGVVGIEEVVFAIFDDGENLRVFKEVFQDVASQ
jgi:uncharacterized protein (TIGR02452 family)